MYLLCVGREEAWEPIWPEDRIMTSIQSAGLATGKFNNSHSTDHVAVSVQCANVQTER